MLEDHEQQKLHAFERQFMAEDPQFMRSFTSRAQRLDRTRSTGSMIVAVTVTVVLCSLTLGAGSPSGAVAFAVGIWLVWWAWRDSHRRKQSRDGRPR
ncbi:DUF3040 domain-containing protein [Pseudonocardia sp. N23]|uniref:DUF3040 domain-containing protein n=1 Tax=Pseudonocardia sp. N23 TaxID=1987376 RepID=UPI000C034489|nr:DUF3040 domain-containing protein [Pseudonocardia sp. N23]GAY12168.1 hypothetical protein TOK_0558 [Pseudonocardia sp. N23]